MPHVVFVAPRFLENTNRYVRAFAELDGITLSLVSSDPEQAIPAPLRPRIAGHYRVADCLDGRQLTIAVRAIARSVGPVDRLAGVLEQLQLPMAEVRDALGIDGLTGAVARNFRDKDRMKEVLRARGVPVARSTLARTPGRAAVVRRPGRLPGDRQAAGRPRLARHPPRREARTIWRRCKPTPVEPLQVEEFVRAREHTCETVTIRGEPVWRSGTRYFPSPLEVLETAWIQYAVLLPREDDDPTWTRFHPTNGEALAALFGDRAGTAAGTALTHMEWFLREDGTCLVNEVGARPPGVHIMPLMGLAHETDMFADWARLMALDTLHPEAAPVRRRLLLLPRPRPRLARRRRRGRRSSRRGVRRRARRDAHAEARPAARRRLRGRGLGHRQARDHRGPQAGACAR